MRRLQDERLNILNQSEPGLEIEQLWAITSTAPMNTDSNDRTLLVSQLENLQLARSEVDGLDEEIKSLKQMIAELEHRASGYGANASELSRLERDLKVKRELYDDLLLRRENARITSSLGIFEQDKRIKVIDRPFTPTAPDNPPIVPVFHCWPDRRHIYGLRAWPCYWKLVIPHCDVVIDLRR